MKIAEHQLFEIAVFDNSKPRETFTGEGPTTFRAVYELAKKLKNLYANGKIKIKLKN